MFCAKHQSFRKDQILLMCVILFEEVQALVYVGLIGGCKCFNFTTVS